MIQFSFRQIKVNGDADKRCCSSKESLRERTLTFDYGGVKVRGVNLGGWLVLERKPSWKFIISSSISNMYLAIAWITPSIFESVPGAVDEFTLCANLGQAACQSKLSTHWE